MGLVLGLAELGLFLTFAAVCVTLALTIIFAILGAAFGAVGLALEADGEDIFATTVFTMIAWGLSLVAGGICSALGMTGLWNHSPFGWIQARLGTAIQPYLASAPRSWANDYSWMWATFWSYCITSLLFSIVVVVLCIVWTEVRSASQQES